MGPPTSSHPSYRLSCAPPIPVRPRPRKFYVGAKRGSDYHLYLMSVLTACWRSRIEYDKKVPNPMDRKKRYDYVPPGPSPLAKTHVPRRGRGGNKKFRRDREKVKAEIRDAAHAARLSVDYIEKVATALPDVLASMSMGRSEDEEIKKLLTPRTSKPNRQSKAARAKDHTTATSKARRIRRIKAEERAFNEAPRE